MSLLQAVRQSTRSLNVELQYIIDNIMNCISCYLSKLQFSRIIVRMKVNLIGLNKLLVLYSNCIDCARWSGWKYQVCLLLPVQIFIGNTISDSSLLKVVICLFPSLCFYCRLGASNRFRTFYDQPKSLRGSLFVAVTLTRSLWLRWLR